MCFGLGFRDLKLGFGLAKDGYFVAVTGGCYYYPDDLDSTEMACKMEIGFKVNINNAAIMPTWITS